SPISWLMRQLGLVDHNVNFLGDAYLAIAAVCLANIWRGIPFFGVAILAGLWQRFRSVTLPVIRGVVLITTLYSIIWTFADFQLIYVLTKGGPANQTH